jgi:hypothetical protein
MQSAMRKDKSDPNNLMQPSPHLRDGKTPKQITPTGIEFTFDGELPGTPSTVRGQINCQWLEDGDEPNVCASMNFRSNSQEIKTG